MHDNIFLVILSCTETIEGMTIILCEYEVHISNIAEIFKGFTDALRYIIQVIFYTLPLWNV